MRIFWLLKLPVVMHEMPSAKDITESDLELCYMPTWEPTLNVNERLNCHFTNYIWILNVFFSSLNWTRCCCDFDFIHLTTLIKLCHEGYFCIMKDTRADNKITHGHRWSNKSTYLIYTTVWCCSVTLSALSIQMARQWLILWRFTCSGYLFNMNLYSVCVCLCCRLVSV